MEKNLKAMDPASKSLWEALTTSFFILKIIMGLLLVLFLCSGIFKVKPGEKAIVLRFGKIVAGEKRILKPGLHWTFPLPISEIIRIPTGKVHSVVIEDFWYHENIKKSPTSATRISPTLDPEKDGYLLTKDANIIHSKWQVQYQIDNAYFYVLRQNNPHKLLKNIISGAIVKSSAHFSAWEVLYEQTDQLRSSIIKNSQKELDLVQSGLKIIAINMVEEGIVPPRQVKSDFESVTLAEREKNKKIETATGYSSQILSKAKGEYSLIVKKAENSSLQVQKQIQSDAAYFAKVLPQFRAHPYVFVQRHYQKAMEVMAPHLQEIFFLSRNQGKVKTRIQINRNPKKARKKKEE